MQQYVADEYFKRLRGEKLQPEEEVRTNQVMWTHGGKLSHHRVTARQPAWPLSEKEPCQNRGGTFRIFNIQVSR